MQLIIDTSNTKISVRNKAFYIENENTSKTIGIKRVSSIAITVHCYINASAIKLAAQNQISIYFYNNFGTLQARICSPFLVNMADLRRQQLYYYDSPDATDWAIEMIERKTFSQISLLQQLANRKQSLKSAVQKSMEQMNRQLQKTAILRNKHIDTVRMQLIGIEGGMARVYFNTLRLFVPENFKFTKRSRRPATDFFNAGLNYLYGMTYSIVESGIYAKGLDPFAGFLHTENYLKPNLVYDLIEPIRPIIDKLWIQLIQTGEINQSHFIKKEQGYWLNKAGKRVIIPTFNGFLKKRFKVDDKFYSLKGYVFTLSNDLGKRIEAYKKR